MVEWYAKECERITEWTKEKSGNNRFLLGQSVRRKYSKGIYFRRTWRSIFISFRLILRLCVCVLVCNCYNIFVSPHTNNTLTPFTVMMVLKKLCIFIVLRHFVCPETHLKFFLFFHSSRSTSICIVRNSSAIILHLRMKINTAPNWRHFDERYFGFLSNRMREKKHETNPDGSSENEFSVETKPNDWSDERSGEKKTLRQTSSPCKNPHNNPTREREKEHQLKGSLSFVCINCVWSQSNLFLLLLPCFFSHQRIGCQQQPLFHCITSILLQSALFKLLLLLLLRSFNLQFSQN